MEQLQLDFGDSAPLQPDELPAGTYYIGDPCYVIRDWDEFLNVCGTDKFFTFRGYKIFMSYTAYGDGVYVDVEEGGEYPVDSGSIGAIPTALCCTPADGGDIDVRFPQNFACSFDGRFINIGRKKIDTDPRDSEEEC
jgi:hypothetical protein